MKVEFNRILCATDLSDHGTHAISRGVAVARQYGSHLILSHVVDLPMATGSGGPLMHYQEYQQRMTTHAREELSAIMASQTVAWEARVETGSAADTIVRMAADEAVDLVVCATHGRTGLKRLFLGSVTERLVRTISRPLLIVTPPAVASEAGAGEPLHLGCILVGCDFSPGSSLALDYGLALAQEFEAELHLVHVVEPVNYQDLLMPYALTEDFGGFLQERLAEKLALQVPDDAHNWCSVHTDCLTGDPANALVGYAQRAAVDLMVLGVRGRSMVETLMLGSTTDRVIRQAPCPVLSVNPDARPGSSPPEG